MESLDRGVVAVPAKDGGMLVSWRLRGDDPTGAAFNLYKDGRKLNAKPLTGGTDFVDETSGAGLYRSPGRQGQGSAASKPVQAWRDGYLSIPIERRPAALPQQARPMPTPPTTPVSATWTATAATRSS
ncbi:hypothetical protein ACRAWD_18980 [Caulobacter segnis]